MLAPDDQVIPLNSEERCRLDQLESLIESTLQKFLICGRALAEIRARQLYRETHPTFETYTVARWGMSAHHAATLIRSVTVAENLLNGPAGPNGTAPLPPDISESTLRPLSRFSNSQLQQNAWTLINSLGTKPTASTVAKVTRSIRQAIETAYDCNDRQPVDRREPPAHELIFLRPIHRLANNQFDPQVICLSIDTPQRARKFALACREVSRRCEMVVEQLRKQFPGLSECRQPELATEAIE
jgi:hypothetical protein